MTHKKSSNLSSSSRRQFLRNSAIAGIAGSGVVAPSWWLPNAAAATPAFNDYKALVCVFLYGGNDSLSMLVPTGSADGTGYGDYADIRGNLAIANNDLGLSTVSSSNTDLNNGNLATGSGNPYYSDGTASSAYVKGLYNLAASKGINAGVNGLMPELAQLVTDNKASLISNIGTLVERVDRNQIINGSPNLPLFLFAHNHQQRALQTGLADNLNAVGWAGRIADAWDDVNNQHPIGLNVSYFGSDRMMIGQNQGPLVLGTGAPPTLTGMRATRGNSHQDRRALYRALAGQQGGTSRVNFDANATYAGSNPFAGVFNDKSTESMNVFDELATAWAASDPSYNSTGSYGEPLFDVPTPEDLGFSNTSLSGSLIRQFAAAAKMIWLGSQGLLGSGYQRQVFYLRMGGFDTHGTQVDDHPRLLRELSLALWKFQNAMQDLNLENQVTTFTMSDFGRTVSNNGDGTDHAWGAHHIVMGGDGTAAPGNLRGGQLLGTLPDLRLGGADDYSSRGRIIPTLAQDQLNATLCGWFGVDGDLMPTIFPNLQNFRSGSALDTAYLNNLFA